MPPPDSPHGPPSAGSDAHRADHSHPTAGPDADRFAELLDLDGEVLHEYWTAALDLVRRTAGPGPVRHVLDLGCGTGAGALGLAERFGRATVTAVDVSDLLLGRLRVNAAGRGLAGRIRTVGADLDAGWPDLGLADAEVDLTWASMSLHHLADVDRVLGHVAAATRPGGLLALAEFAAPLRFLPDEAGSAGPGLEGRIEETLEAGGAGPRRDLRARWSEPLRAAGFRVVEERTFPIDLRVASGPGSAAAAAVRYARIWFDRMLAAVGDRLADDDRARLAALATPRPERDGPAPPGPALWIRGSRTVTIGQR